MIYKIAKIICSVIPHKNTRHHARIALANNLLDLTGKIAYLNDSLIPEFERANNLISPSSKILVIAPHPDDDVIGCGGILAKYANQCDVMCINSSGFKRPWDTETYEQIADMRIQEFNNVMNFLGIKKYWIWKIFGQPPHFDKILANKGAYLSAVNFSEYTHIFVPDRNDGHREHQFLSNYFIPELLKTQGYNRKTIICHYPVWGTTTNPNYFEDISPVQDKKVQALLLYTSRMQAADNYAQRMTGLNYFYGLFIGTKYAEAFHCENIKDFLAYPDTRNWAKYK